MRKRINTLKSDVTNDNINNKEEEALKKVVQEEVKPIKMGDSLASKALKIKKNKR